MVLGVALGAIEEVLIAITTFQWEQEKYATTDMTQF
jgi:hypothetical protein